MEHSEIRIKMARIVVNSRRLFIILTIIVVVVFIVAFIVVLVPTFIF
jgi:hypothetical protein